MQTFQSSYSLLRASLPLWRRTKKKEMTISTNPLNSEQCQSETPKSLVFGVHLLRLIKVLCTSVMLKTDPLYCRKQWLHWSSVIHTLTHTLAHSSLWVRLTSLLTLICVGERVCHAAPTEEQRLHRAAMFPHTTAYLLARLRWEAGSSRTGVAWATKLGGLLAELRGLHSVNLE